MTIQPGAMKKAQFYKKMLFFVNIPLVIGIPLFVEFGLSDFQKKDINLIYMVLHLTDFFLCFNSIVIYSLVSKLVTGITYLPDEHKLKIKKCKDWFLREKEEIYEPQELVKCKKQVLNPFIGYRSTTNMNDRFATESIGLWHDRQLMDSMIHREIVRKRRQPVSANAEAKKDGEEADNNADGKVNRIRGASNGAKEEKKE